MSYLWSNELVKLFQNFGSSLYTINIMQALTFIGSNRFYILLLPLIYWCINKKIGIDLIILSVIQSITNGTLKVLIKHPRPFWSDVSLKKSFAGGFSCPSGHPQSTSTIFGYLALIFSKSKMIKYRWLYVILCVFTILTVAVSRVLLGVHYPGDVLFGILLGIITVSVYYFVMSKKVLEFKKNFSKNLLFMLTILSLIVLINIAFLNSNFGICIKNTKCYEMGEHGSFNYFSSSFGTFLGVYIGFVMESRFVNFFIESKIWKRCLQYFIGILGIFVINYSFSCINFDVLLFKFLMPEVVLKYIFLMLWIVFFWPLLFVKLKLAKQKEK